jgi:hypothetical protein
VRRHLFVCLAALFAAACDRSSAYHGDGTFSDQGPGAAHERYVVDLGPVDLSNPGRRSFRLLGLPPVEFTIGLRPVNVSSGCDATALKTVTLRIHVQSEDGAVIVDEQGPLGTWTSSSDLVYRRGTENQEPQPDGAVKLVRAGVRSSGGWGTYFTPRSSAAYLASFEVLDAHGASGCESRLVLLGGGWK